MAFCFRLQVEKSTKSRTTETYIVFSCRLYIQNLSSLELLKPKIVFSFRLYLQTLLSILYRWLITNLALIYSSLKGSKRSQTSLSSLYHSRFHKLWPNRSDLNLTIYFNTTYYLPLYGLSTF